MSVRPWQTFLHLTIFLSFSLLIWGLPAKVWHPLSFHDCCCQYCSTPRKDESKCLKIKEWPLTNPNTRLCSIKLGSYVNTPLHHCHTGRWVVLDLGFILAGLKAWSHSCQRSVWLQFSRKLRREERGRDRHTTLQRWCWWDVSLGWLMPIYKIGLFTKLSMQLKDCLG